MEHMSGIIQSHEGLLLQSLADVLDWVASPNLAFFDYSTGWDHTVGSNDAALLEDGSFHNDGVVTHVDSSFDQTRVKSAVVLDDCVSLQDEARSQTGGGGGRGVQYTVVADADILIQAKCK